MTFRVNAIGAAFCTVTAAMVVFQPSITGAKAGFALSFVINLAFQLVLGVRTYSNLDMDMNAVKQVTEYLSLQMEDYDRGADVSPSWPSHGRLEIRDLNVRYGPGLPEVQGSRPLCLHFFGS